MQKLKIISESRTIIFTVVIIVAVAITGALLYLNLSSISQKISESVKTGSPASIITKQILIDLRSADNNARSFHLTQDSSYIQAYYNAIPNFENRINDLKKLSFENHIYSHIIDSIIILSYKGFALIKVQSYMEDPVKIANELNQISKKIDETFEPSTLKTASGKKIKDFFKRLFNKNDFKLYKPEIASKNIEIINTKEQLKKTVLEVKSFQMQQLSEYKQSEYQFSKEALQIIERLNFFADELKLNEDIKALKESNFINQEVNKLKYYSILFSIIISCFLFMLVYLFINYIKKKNHYALALLESKQKAEELAKAKESFLANMSHEIKTPLNAIYGFTEQILASELKPEQENQLNIVKSSISYLTKLINNILTYAKLQSGKSQIEISNFNLKKEFSDIEKLFESLANTKGIALKCEIDENIPEIIRSDVNKIKQVIFNIVGNAIKFTNKGEVKIALKLIETREIKLINIVVSDTGIGIEEAKLPKIFNEFEQGDEKIFQKYGGTGLGLAITRQIIKQLSGKIEINSKINVGTTITLTFPIEYSGEFQIETKEEISQNHEIEKLFGTKILIVDDEEFNRLLLKSILKKYQVTIFEAVNGNDAINFVKNQQFDLVIMDIRMPDITGIEASREIRKFDKTIPILASTAVTSEEKIAKWVYAGMNGFVFKPFTENELLKTLIDTLKRINKIEIQQPDIKKAKYKIINIENINEYSNGDENFKKEMLQLFSKSINNGLIKIENYSKSKNFTEISNVAHKIIPSCKYFEAIDLLDILRYFENLNNKSKVNETELNKNLDALRVQINFINKELELHL